MKFFGFLTFFALCLLGVSAIAAPLSFTVNMSEAVNVTGTPRISVNVGGVTRYASYASGTGTSALTFTYTPQAGDLDLDGVAVSSPVDLNGGAITDLNGNAISNLTFTPPNTANVKVDYPSLSMDFTGSDYILSGTHYGTLSSFLTAASGSFTRGSVGTYFDSTGTLQTAGNNVARFDHDPTTHAAKGILMEESRTNGVRNNTMLGAVAGTPGTLPTNWNYTGGNGLSTALTGVGTENGINYVDVRFYGTTTTSGPRGVRFENSTTCTAVPSGKNSISAYMKIQSGSTSNINLWYLIAGGLTSGGASTGEYRASNPAIGTGALSQQRYVSVLTFTNATTAAIFPYLEFYPTGTGVPIDVTVRIGLPQCEQGAFATSVIPTTNAATTRTSDSLTVPTGAWYGASAHTLTATYSIPFVGGAGYPSGTAIDDGTGNNAIMLFVSDASTDYNGAEVWQSGVMGFSNSGAIYSSGTTTRQAVYYETNMVRASVNGVLGALDTSVGIPSVNTLRVGRGRGGGHYLNGTVQKLKYYPARVADTQLQLLTQ